MAAAIGYVTAALQLGLDAILVKPKRGFGGFTAHVTMKETHTDELEITEQPVEEGGAVSDHAFKRPAEVTIECAWSDSPPTGANVLSSLGGAVSGTIAGVSSILSGNSKSQVKDVYAKLLDLQQSRQPFDVLTGKRAYKNMLVRSLIVSTDDKTENMLMVRAVFKQVLLASVSTVKSTVAPKARLKDPSKTCSPLDKGMAALKDGASFNPLAGLNAGVVSSVSDISTSVSSQVGSIPGTGLTSVTGISY